jgi:astacin
MCIITGMKRGRQDLILVDACKRGSVIHEIGHTVGLCHEQSREDRDRFIKINWGNINLEKNIILNSI